MGDERKQIQASSYRCVADECNPMYLYCGKYYYLSKIVFLTKRKFYLERKITLYLHTFQI